MPLYILSDDPSSGIVTSPSVGVDPTLVVSGSFQALIGDGTSTDITVTHNRGTRDMSVEVFRVASPYDVVKVDIDITTTNAITLHFAVAPATNEYRVLIRPTE